MSRRSSHGAGHPKHRGSRRKWDDFATTIVHNGMVTGTFAASDVGAIFAGKYGYLPHQSTLDIPRFDMQTDAAGTGTGTNLVTLGFKVASSAISLTDPSLDPVLNADDFWWVRKYQVQNNSNPPGVLWAIQGVDALDWKVNTRRTLKLLGDTLWCSIRVDYTGFTAASFNTSVSLHVGILYP